MIKIKRIFGIVTITAALVASGCANVTSKQVPSIPGVDTSSVNLFINNDDGSATLTGNVSRAIDKRAIEEYVRNEYGYKKITNNITSD